MEFSSDKNRQYQINDFLFFPGQKVIERLRDHHKDTLFPQEVELLELLLINENEVVSNERIALEVWKTEDVSRVRANIRQAIHRLRQFLGKETIKTAFNQGYCFVGQVIRQVEPSFTEDLQEKNIFKTTISAEKIELTDTPSSEIFAGYFHFVFLESLMYSAIAVVSLHLETAYQFSEFQQLIFFLSIPVAIVAFLLTVSCFWLNYVLCVKYKSGKGMAFGFGTLLFSTIMIIAIGYQILPNYPITQTTFSAQSAQFAFLKDLGLYLFPIFFLAVLTPYNSILVWKRELADGNHKNLWRFLRNKFGLIEGTPNISAKWMIFCLFLLFLYSLSSMFYLFDHLIPSDNTHRFIYLMVLRNALYFVSALIGIWWYYENRKKIIDQCRNR